jgi:predicted hydrocarbon binding protein
MTEGSTGRRLPNRFVHPFFHTVEEQMGKYSLHMLLRQAGLEHYIDQLPPANRKTCMLSSEYAQFQGAFRAYYGKGARGALNRIGRRVFQCLIKASPLRSRLCLFWIRLMPRAARGKKGLDFLASQLREPDGKISVHTLDLDLVFVVATSDSACGQSALEPICWVTQGMIQEALLWAAEVEPEVEEISCQAAGGETCTFRIYTAE